jgi:hypothetical protein
MEIAEESANSFFLGRTEWVSNAAKELQSHDPQIREFWPRLRVPALLFFRNQSSGMVHAKCE